MFFFALIGDVLIQIFKTPYKTFTKNFEFLTADKESSIIARSLTLDKVFQNGGGSLDVNKRRKSNKKKSSWKASPSKSKKSSSWHRKPPKKHRTPSSDKFSSSKHRAPGSSKYISNKYQSQKNNNKWNKHHSIGNSKLDSKKYPSRLDNKSKWSSSHPTSLGGKQNSDRNRHNQLHTPSLAKRPRGPSWTLGSSSLTNNSKSPKGSLSSVHAKPDTGKRPHTVTF